ncbi:MAG: LpqB family beta-propeller domain-containing protein [Acidobacteriaceae bacterium]|jgi:Tol biopolymer transport system component/DNA-binding winged helix-turn-helix (wHTH) protein
MESPLIYRFDGFTLDAATRRLRRGGRDLLLEPKSFRLLEFLIENRDRVLGKEEIFRVVWEETIVTDNALTRAIAQIRKVLEDDPRQPRFIETLPTVGYRFIGKLTTQESASAAVPVPRESPRPLVWVAIGLAILAAAGWAAWRFWPWPSVPAVYTPVPLTTYRGNEEAPSFSPDGSQVAFEWDGEKQDNFDIYVKAMGPDAAPLRLTTDPLPDRMPSWSPDGSTIAFLRIMAPGQAELMLIPALGGPERRLAPIPIIDDPVWLSKEGTPAWTLDGKWLIVPGLVKQHTVLLRVSVDTGDLEQITEPGLEFDDKSPAISPDGTTLLFNRMPTFYSQGTLYVVRLDQNAKPVGDPKPISSQELSIKGATWMENGREVVAFTPNGLYRIPVQGGGKAQPVPGTGSEIQSVAVSRQGARLAFAVMHGDANVWRLNLSARDPKPERLIASTFRDVSPRYSPDGSQIAFESMRGGGRNQVWLSDAEGKQARQLTFVKQGLAGSPHWSPDGRMLEWDSNSTGHYQIYTMDADGGRMTQLTNDRFDNFGASWSRDGRSLYFTSTRTGRTEVWKMPAAGGTAVQVTRNGGEFGIESEDGKMLYFTRILRADSGSIWRMPVSGGPEEQLADSLYRVNYAVAKRGIYYMTHADEAGNSTLKFYAFATGATSTVLAMGRPEYGLDVSPDGRYLVYAQLDDPASDLMLIENFR